MLFEEKWRSLNERCVHFCWWQRFLYAPLIFPAIVFAAACYFPKLTGLGTVAVVIVYGYNIYNGMYSLADIFMKDATILAFYTAYSYALVTFEFLKETVCKHFGSPLGAK